MAATRQFIKHSVGDKGVNAKSDVAALQHLLVAAGEPLKGGIDRAWGNNTAAALLSFQKKHMERGVKQQRLVSPGDYVLLLAAWQSGILIPMPGKAGIAGVLAMHKWFVDNRVAYNAGAEEGGGNRAIWGVHDDLRYAVQTTSGTYERGPVEMDCTTYVNMMVSIFMNGHVHSAPYEASCAAFGGVSATHCARDRYLLPLVRRSTAAGATVNYFESAAQIGAATASDPNGLYVLEIATAGTGSVKHMALLTGGTTYECTTGQSGSACISRSLDDFMKNKKGRIVYLFGPSPTRR